LRVNIVTSMPNVTLLFKIQHLAAFQFTKVALTVIQSSLHSLHVM